MNDLDGYWRSRTINEAQLEGHASVRLTCSCGRVTDYPFVLLLQRRNVTRHTFLGNIRFKCKQCGGREPSIGVYKQSQCNHRGISVLNPQFSPRFTVWLIGTLNAKSERFSGTCCCARNCLSDPGNGRFRFSACPQFRFGLSLRGGAGSSSGARSGPRCCCLSCFGCSFARPRH
jgi:hypothetical protein